MFMGAIRLRLRCWLSQYQGAAYLTNRYCNRMNEHAHLPLRASTSIDDHRRRCRRLDGFNALVAHLLRRVHLASADHLMVRRAQHEVRFARRALPLDVVSVERRVFTHGFDALMGVVDRAIELTRQNHFVVGRAEREVGLKIRTGLNHERGVGHALSGLRGLECEALCCRALLLQGALLRCSLLSSAQLTRLANVPERHRVKILATDVSPSQLNDGENLNETATGARLDGRHVSIAMLVRWGVCDLRASGCSFTRWGALDRASRCSIGVDDPPKARPVGE
jgi:hypothetical protein